MPNDKQKTLMADFSYVLQRNHRNSCAQTEHVDLESIKGVLGMKSHENGYALSFFNKVIQISDNKIVAPSDNKVDHMVSVIIAKYILLSPLEPKLIPGWASLKDFKKDSNFISANAISADFERTVEKLFSGRLEDLNDACERSGGIRHDLGGVSYDLSMMFSALPRLSILLLFNDLDEEFPAKCSILFQKHAEYYLDPESLIMLVEYLITSLKKSSQQTK